MPLPTMSVRGPPEHHQLIRDIATALRTRPELADVLRDVLQAQHGITPRNTNVLQPILDRLATLEARSMSVGSPSTPDEAEPTQPHLTLDQTRQIDAMMKAGKSAEEIMKVTGRPIPTREEIKQRLLDEISPPRTMVGPTLSASSVDPGKRNS
jgi:hypothetical protein